MSKYKVDSESLTAVADAIRAKTGNDEPLEFPDEFVSEIGNISVGGDSLFHEKVGDGNAYLYIYLPTKEHLSVTMYVRVTNVSNTDGFTVDWGDGSAPEVIGRNISHEQHTYPAAGYYTIKLYNVSGNCYLGGSGNTWLFGGASYPNRFGQGILIGVETGSWLYSGAELLINSNLAFLYSGSGSPEGSGTNCVNARECRLLSVLEISTHATTIPSYCYYNCFALREVIIPANITVISGSAFGGVKATFHMIATTPPTLSSTSAFTSYSTFYVPYSADHSILAAYKAATNWANFESQILEEPEV